MSKMFPLKSQRQFKIPLMKEKKARLRKIVRRLLLLATLATKMGRLMHHAKMSKQKSLTKLMMHKMVKLNSVQ